LNFYQSHPQVSPPPRVWVQLGHRHHTRRAW
jgi:hypothetical protein